MVLVEVVQVIYLLFCVLEMQTSCYYRGCALLSFFIIFHFAIKISVASFPLWTQT